MSETWIAGVDQAGRTRFAPVHDRQGELFA
jgi:hypothetical protein